MDDLISRQAAINALGERPLTWTGSDYELGALNQWEHDVEAIKAMPTGRDRGKWLFDGQYLYPYPDSAWSCSECGEHTISVDTPWQNYCPNCGAEMEKGEQDGKDT